jgi:hypothetical protein
VLYQELRGISGKSSVNSRPKRVEDRGRAFASRSRAYVAFHSTEVCGGASGRIHQRQERDPLARTGPRVRRAKQDFVGQQFWARGYFVKTSASISLSRKVASYPPRPRLRNQSPTSMIAPRSIAVDHGRGDNPSPGDSFLNDRNGSGCDGQLLRRGRRERDLSRSFCDRTSCWIAQNIK